MKTVYITENQVKVMNESENQTRNMLLTEENSTIKRKIKEIIRQYCNDQVAQYLDTPLNELPMGMKQQLNPGGNPTAMWRSVANNPNENKFIDFLKVNLYDQLGTKRGKGPWEYVLGGARILCQDLGFYSFSESVMRGGAIIRFSKLLRTIHNHKDIFIGNGPDMDRDLNGMNYVQFMWAFAEKYDEWKKGERDKINSEAVVSNGNYTVVAIQDVYSGNGCIPVGEGRALLTRLGDYTDWCICGEMQDFEYPQYTGGGGKVYIMMKNGFENIQKQVGENCPLDEYGLSLICVIVGPDGMPDNITTRWNHENDGENPEGLSTASELQRVTNVKYFDVFKPRSNGELSQMHMLYEDEDKPSAMDQVHNKVNAGIMDAVTGCGMMEESQGNLETWYRGYNSKYGSDHDHLLWLTDDIDYARCYGNRVEEVILDGDKLNSICVTDLLDCGYDYLDGPDEEGCEEMLSEGYNCYYFEANDDSSYCICLWDKSAIVSRRELSREEFDKIEGYEGYDNPSYDAELNEMYCDGLINENSNDRKVNKYIKEKFGLTDFQDIRNKVMEIYEKIPYSRINGGQYMLGVLRLLFEENIPRDEYSVLNKILYKIAHCNYYEKEKAGVLDPNFNGQGFDELKEKLYVPDFEGTEFSTSEKQVKVANGYTVTRIDSYDEMNAVCDGEWCISYDDSMWYDLVEDGTVYLVENERLIDEYDREYEKNPEFWQDLGYMTDDEDEMMDKGYINDQYYWTYKPGDWKFPYDIYGMSRFVVIVYKDNFTCYSRWNMPNDFDGDYLTKQQIERLLGVKFEDVFKPTNANKYNGWEYDKFGRRVPFGSVQYEMAEGAEPESDEYKIGGEGGNNEYFHVMNESKIGNFDFKKYFKPIAEFMKEDGLNVYPYPKVKLNWDPQDGLFIKTGYYEPESKTIVIFCDDRHPKDILRTFCHEMIHHSQNLDGVDLNFTSNDDVKDNERLEEIESEAYLKGNVYFRKWTEYQHKNNDLLQESSIKESPDFANGNRYYEPDAIPFGTIKGSDEIMVGNRGEIHLEMLRDYLDSTSPGMWQERFDGKVGAEIFDEAFDAIGTGRYWPNDNLISFWQYNKGLRGANQIIRNVVKSIEDSYGMSVDLDALDVDIWTYNDHECDCIVPFYWISHNFADVFIESARYIKPIGDGTYEITMNNYERRRFDVKGYEIQPEYAMYESIDTKKALSDLRKRRDPDGIEKLDEDTNPEDIDLSSFNIKTALNPKFWKDGRLDSRIRMKLLDIADDFIEFLGIDWVKPDDIIMTGSLANYNWNKKFSDIDLHILIDYSKVDKRTDFVDNYFYSQKKLWNEEHEDLKIYGFPVELYVQDTNEEHSSTGVYSLDKDKWLVEPERKKLKDAKINKTLIKNKVADYIDKIEKLLTIYKEADDDYKVRKVSEDADKLFDKIKKERKEGLKGKEIEITNGNLVFKCLRRLGYIEKITDLMSDTYDKLNSLS